MPSLAESNPYLRTPEMREAMARRTSLDCCAVEIEDDQERAEFIARATSQQFPAGPLAGGRTDAQPPSVTPCLEPTQKRPNKAYPRPK